MTNDEPSRLDRIEQMIEDLARSLAEDRQQRQRIHDITELHADISMEELSQKVSKMHEELNADISIAELNQDLAKLLAGATQRQEARIAAEPNTEPRNLWQEESDRHRALIQQKLGKLAEQRKAEIEKFDRLDRGFKTIRLLAWLSFALIFCASATVIFTTVFEAGKP